MKTHVINLDTDYGNLRDLHIEENADLEIVRCYVYRDDAAQLPALWVNRPRYANSKKLSNKKTTNSKDAQFVELTPFFVECNSCALFDAIHEQSLIEAQ